MHHSSHFGPMLVIYNPHTSHPTSYTTSVTSIQIMAG